MSSLASKMSGDSNSSMALLTEHLRHTPVSLIDDIINSINTIGYKAVDWVEQGLLATPLSNLGFPETVNGETDQGEREALEEKIRHEIENGVHQFETLLEATIDKNFDKMEIFALRSIIAIPDDLKDWIRLQHYEGLNFDISPDTPTIESITLQRRKYQETQRLHRLLQAEVARNESLITQLKALLSTTAVDPTKPSTPDLDAPMTDTSTAPTYASLAFLTHPTDLIPSSATTPLSTTAAFALSQLPAMNALLQDLQPATTALESLRKNPNLAPQEAQNGEKSWRRQRLEYVEAQTRQLQENVRGLELGPQGAVRDGEWQEEGRRVGREEVEALERVVAMVQGEEMDEGA